MPQGAQPDTLGAPADFSVRIWVERAISHHDQWRDGSNTAPCLKFVSYLSNSSNHAA